MGIAIFWVVLFHSRGEFTNPILEVIKRLGFCGVDIFLFLSGIGIYYSLIDTRSRFDFYKKRILRIYPSYFIVLLFYSMFLFLNESISFKGFFANIFLINFFIGFRNTFDWYTPSIIILYLISPYVFKVRSSKKLIFYLIIFLAILISLSIVFNLNYLLIFLTRIPIFLMGIIFGEKVKNNIKVSSKEIYIVLTMMVIGLCILGVSIIKFPEYLRYYGLWWYPFILITPGMTFIMAKFLEVIKIKYLFKFLNLLGTYSFEIYLIHERVLHLLKDVINNIYILNFLSIIVTATLAFYLKKVINILLEVKLEKAVNI